MDTIGRWALRVPEGTDGPADVPLWMDRLATDLSDVAKDNQGTLAGRPTSTVLAPTNTPGAYYVTTNEEDPAGSARRRIYRDHGAGYDELVTVPVSRRMIDATLLADSGTSAAKGAAGSLGRWYRATDTGQLFFDTGAAWLDIPQRQAPVLTFPTTNLYEGLEVLIQTSQMLADGIAPYRFRYRSAIPDSYKWEALSPTFWFHRWSGTSSGSASLVYANIGDVTTPVEYVAPFAGVWSTRWGFKHTQAQSGTASQESYLVPVVVPGELRNQVGLDTDAIHDIWQVEEGIMRPGNASRCDVQCPAAGAHIRLQQRHPGVAVNWPVQDPWMEVWPVRCI
jgi:hypothetical protein